jgi:hypothetical protein
MAIVATYDLRHPIEFAETRITTVEIVRPTARNLLLMDDHQGRPVALTIAMVEALTTLTKGQVQALDVEDFGPLGELVMSYVAPGPRTGETA